LRRDRNFAIVGVRDTGVGIEPGMLRSLFEPFAQAPQTIDRARGGLGLGLAMAKGLIELHGGSVDVASDGPGKGTAVTMAIPTQDDVPVTLRPPEPQEKPPQRRILIIEDHADSAETLQCALAFDGHDVQWVSDGPSALVLAERFHPDAVVCDLGLPDMDGFAVARAFREKPSLQNIRLIALSGYARDEDVRRATEAGFDHHVAKPPDLRKLRALLASPPPVHA
jgi:two-component system CheB/CheR fusion protein